MPVGGYGPACSLRPPTGMLVWVELSVLAPHFPPRGFRPSGPGCRGDNVLVSDRLTVPGGECFQHLPSCRAHKYISVHVSPGLLENRIV